MATSAASGTAPGAVRPVVLVQAHRQQILDAAAHRRATRIRVVGSVARGVDVQASDIDFLATFGPEASVFDQAGLQEDLQRILGIPVDVVSAGALGPRRARFEAEAVAL